MAEPRAKGRIVKPAVPARPTDDVAVPVASRTGLGTGVQMMRTGGVLLLQGPVGPFFARLGRCFVRAGIPCRRVVFNAADHLFAGNHPPDAPRVIKCRVGEGDWQRWLEEELDRAPPAVVILFGCERDRHAVAREACAARAIPVLCLEEGYVRPGFVTAEWGGNNRLSPIADATLADLKAAADRPLPPACKGHAFNAMAMWGAVYYIVRALGKPFYPSTQHHKDRPLVSEAFRWLRNPWRAFANEERNKRLLHDLLENHYGRFYLVPLQVRDDMQLVKAGRGWTNERLIEETVASFAAHAPSDRRLLIKVHPLERGHSDAISRTARIAARHGVADRVVVLDGETLGLMVSACAGMITINSTSAFSAMLRLVPLGVLGHAMFRRDDLATVLDKREDIDAFWTGATSRPAERLDAFRHYMAVSALVPGDFYTRANSKVGAHSVLALLDRELSVETARLSEQAQREAGAGKRSAVA